MYEFKRKIQGLINIYHLFKAVIANIVYWFPSKKIKVIGVTGTDGKTTTVHLIYHILKSAGKKTSLISSVYAKIGRQVFQTGLHTTTPDSFLVQRLIRRAVRAGDKYLILETTSHALDQNRVHGINFAISVLTNVTPEHLDYHKTYENYLNTKVKLFLMSDITVLNADDRSGLPVAKFLKGRNKKYYTYGLKNKAFFIHDFRPLIPDIADFNNYNYLAAYSVAKILELPDEKVETALKSFKLPVGRLETVYNKRFKVIIDFAHTTNSIESVLRSIKKQYLSKKGRLIHVFGAAGLRDQQKRPVMGRASGRYADVVILTEEDYRTEDPQQIAKQIAMGLIKHEFSLVKESSLSKQSLKEYTVIIDRTRAIKKAISIAKPYDVVVLTGKSHEKSLARGKIEYPWDEKRAVERSL